MINAIYQMLRLIKSSMSILYKNKTFCTNSATYLNWLLFLKMRQNLLLAFLIYSIFCSFSEIEILSIVGFLIYILYCEKFIISLYGR
jgi:hypothetical protein